MSFENYITNFRHNLSGYTDKYFSHISDYELNQFLWNNNNYLPGNVFYCNLIPTGSQNQGLRQSQVWYKLPGHTKENYRLVISTDYDDEYNIFWDCFDGVRLLDNLKNGRINITTILHNFGLGSMGNKLVIDFKNKVITLENEFKTSSEDDFLNLLNTIVMATIVGLANVESQIRSITQNTIAGNILGKRFVKDYACCTPEFFSLLSLKDLNDFISEHNNFDVCQVNATGFDVNNPENQTNITIQLDSRYTRGWSFDDVKVASRDLNIFKTYNFSFEALNNFFQSVLTPDTNSGMCMITTLSKNDSFLFDFNNRVLILNNTVWIKLDTFFDQFLKHIITAFARNDRNNRKMKGL